MVTDEAMIMDAVDGLLAQAGERAQAVHLEQAYSALLRVVDGRTTIAAEVPHGIFVYLSQPIASQIRLRHALDQSGRQLEMRVMGAGQKLYLYPAAGHRMPYEAPRPR